MQGRLLRIGLELGVAIQRTKLQACKPHPPSREMLSYVTASE